MSFPPKDERSLYPRSSTRMHKIFGFLVFETTNEQVTQRANKILENNFIRCTKIKSKLEGKIQHLTCIKNIL